MQKESTTHSQREGVQDWVCKACLPTEFEAAIVIEYGVFQREGSCFAKRSWQEHSSYADEDAMATGTCSSKTLASCESGNGIKACRHVDAKSGKTELHAKTVDKKPKEVKKLKKVMFAVEAMETSAATIKNVPNDEVAEIKNESKDAKRRWVHTME